MREGREGGRVYEGKENWDKVFHATEQVVLVSCLPHCGPQPCPGLAGTPWRWPVSCATQVQRSSHAQGRLWSKWGEEMCH